MLLEEGVERDVRRRVNERILISLEAVTQELTPSSSECWSSAMNIIRSMMGEYQESCVSLLSALTTGKRNKSKSYDDVVPVDCVLPLLQKTPDGSTILLGMKSLLHTAECSFYPKLMPDGR